jgi:hypothetical protein
MLSLPSERHSLSVCYLYSITHSIQDRIIHQTRDSAAVDTGTLGNATRGNGTIRLGGNGQWDHERWYNGHTDDWTVAQ